MAQLPACRLKLANAQPRLAALLAAKQDPNCWRQSWLNADSVILLIGSEGATDADIYAQLTSLG